MPCPDDDILSLVRRQCAFARAEAFTEAAAAALAIMTDPQTDPAVRSASRSLFDAFTEKALAASRAAAPAR